MGINKKRFLAYIIDMLLILSIMMIITYFFKNNPNILENQKQLNILNEQYIKNEIPFSSYFNDYSKYVYQIDKNNLVVNIINIIIMILYFIILPYKTNGFTLGKYIMKIKIEEKDKKNIKLKTLTIRTFVINGLLFLILSLINLLIFKNQTYFVLLTILGFLQILLVIISCFMVIYRHDLCGLQDILSKSKVVKR